MNPPTSEELLLWLRDTEHSFVERKVFSDSSDWLKTVVAFANSTPIGYPAVLYIGVKDKGEPQDKAEDLDKIQKSFSEKIKPAYPPIYTYTKILDVDGRQVLAVIVPGSPDRPHFAGPAYVRELSKTVNASKEQFNQLIAERNGKTHEILRWKGKSVQVQHMRVENLNNMDTVASVWPGAVVVDCNQFFVTVENRQTVMTFPLSRVEISHIHAQNRLVLEIYPTR